MDPVTADRQPTLDPVPGDGEQSSPDAVLESVPEQPESTAEDAPELVNDAGKPDFDALVALLGDEDAGPSDDSSAPEDVDEKPPSFGTKYDSMTDEELTEYLRGLTPKQLRAELGNGKAMQSRFNRELQQQRELTRKLESDLAALQETVNSQKAAPATEPAPHRLTERDLFDEEGNLKPGMLSQLIAQEAMSLVEPLKEGLTARERAEQERQKRELEQRLLATETKMKAAFPHIRENPDVMAEVYQFMRDHNVMDMVAAYARLYPRKYAEAVVAFEQKQRKANKPTTRPPVTPASGTSRAESAIPYDDPERFQEALAKEIAKGLG